MKQKEQQVRIVNVIKDSTTECAPFTWGMTLFCYGCNLKCEMCKGYNFERVTNPNSIAGDAVSLIKCHITPFHDCVVFIGGEPTIWGEKLRDALSYCHSRGLKTKIFSNGMLPEEIERINIEGLCDAWSIDFKGLNNLQEEIGLPGKEYFRCFEATIKSINKYELPLEIRTTFYDGNENDRDRIINFVQEKYVIPRQKVYPELFTKYIIQEDARALI